MRYLIIGIFLLAIACVNKHSKKEYKYTNEVCSGLYIETYMVFGIGAYGGDLLSEYMTDSTNFRAYIGTYDDAIGNYSYTCEKNNVFIQKVSRENVDNIKVIETKSFDLQELKNQHLFE